ELRVARRDVHRDIVDQLLEIISACDEVALAVDLHHDAELAAVMNVRADESLFGGARRLLVRGRDAELTKHDLPLRQIAFRLHEGFLALHHARASALT